MEQSVVNKVSGLYKKKSELLDELSILVDDENNLFTLSHYDKTVGNIYGGFRYKTVSDSFVAEIKKLTEAHIKQQIEEVDNELKEL